MTPPFSPQPLAQKPVGYSIAVILGLAGALIACAPAPTPVGKDAPAPTPVAKVAPAPTPVAKVAPAPKPRSAESKPDIGAIRLKKAAGEACEMFKLILSTKNPRSVKRAYKEGMLAAAMEFRQGRARDIDNEEVSQIIESISQECPDLFLEAERAKE